MFSREESSDGNHSINDNPTPPSVVGQTTPVSRIPQYPSACADIPDMTFICKWADCGEILLRVRDVVYRHVEDNHWLAGECKDSRILVNCKWEGCTSKPIQLRALRRHFCTKAHAKLGDVECEGCHLTLARPDALPRHLIACLKCAYCGMSFLDLVQQREHPDQCPARAS